MPKESLPARLAEEVSALREAGYRATLTQSDGWAMVVLHDVGVAVGFNKASTNVLLKLPLSYPHGKPDMFWTDVDLVLANGDTPKQADSVEPALGKDWRRFSWHLSSWNPASDSLLTFIEFVEHRLSTPE